MGQHARIVHVGRMDDPAHDPPCSVSIMVQVGTTDTRGHLYRHLRGLDYRVMDAMGYAYGPPQLPAVAWAENLLGPL